MDARATYTDSDGRARPERRSNLRLRELFDTAYKLVEPFLDPGNDWGGHPLEHLAFRVLRENFPDLSAVELQQLVVAAERVYRDAHRRAEPTAS